MRFWIKFIDWLSDPYESKDEMFFRMFHAHARLLEENYELYRKYQNAIKELDVMEEELGNYDPYIQMRVRKKRDRWRQDCVSSSK